MNGPRSPTTFQGADIFVAEPVLESSGSFRGNPLFQEWTKTKIVLHRIVYLIWQIAIIYLYLKKINLGMVKYSFLKKINPAPTLFAV